MACIGISENRTWFCARWLFSFVLRSVKENFPVDSPLRKAIEIALIDGLGWLDLEHMPGVQLELLRTELIKVYDDLERQGPSAIASPEFYPGLMNHISELIELLEGQKRT
jgi:hypothetical protein